MPLMGLVMAFAIVMGVIVVDVGLIFGERRQAQAAADFAALAAAQDLPRIAGDPDLDLKLATAETTAYDYLRRNGYDPSDPDVDALATTNYADEVDQIEVSVQRPRSWLLGRLFGLGPITVSGRAVAQAAAQPRDVIVVLDRSGSMCADTHGKGSCPNPPGDPDGNGVDDWQPFDQMRLAATGFSDNFEPVLDGQIFDRIGLVTYATDASLDLGLTTSYGANSAYEAAIDVMVPSGWTNIGHALYLARTELEAQDRGAQQIIVLLTDGNANRYLNNGNYASPSFSSCGGGCSAADGDAVAQAQIAASQGVAIYTIGLTGNAGETLLQQIADLAAASGGGGQFFDVDDPDALADTFTQIANIIEFALVE